MEIGHFSEQNHIIEKNYQWEREENKNPREISINNGTKIPNSFHYADLPVHKGKASIDDTGQRVFGKNQSLFERAMSKINPPRLLEEGDLDKTEKS